MTGTLEAGRPDASPRGAVCDVEAFSHLVSRWEKRVFNYLLRPTSNTEDSLDLGQDVFLKACQNIRKVDGAGRFGPWVFRVAHYETYSHFRPPPFTRKAALHARVECIDMRHVTHHVT